MARHAGLSWKYFWVRLSVCSKRHQHQIAVFWVETWVPGWKLPTLLYNNNIHDIISDRYIHIITWKHCIIIHIIIYNNIYIYNNNLRAWKRQSFQDVVTHRSHTVHWDVVPAKQVRWACPPQLHELDLHHSKVLVGLLMLVVLMGGSLMWCTGCVGWVDRRLCID